MTCKEINTTGNKFDIIGRIYGVLVFMAGTGAIIPVIRQQSGNGYNNITTDSVMQNVWYVLYIFTIIFVIYKWEKFVKIIFSNKLIWFICGFATLSAIWSVSTGITLRRCTALFFTQIIGVYLYSEYKLEGVMDLLRWTSGISIILCFVFSIFLPVYGVHHDGVFDGVWRGIYLHKNTLGLNMAIFTPLWMITLLDNIKNKNKGILSFIFLILALTLLIKSQSKTSLCVFIIILSSIPICLVIRKNLSLALGIFFSFITFVGIFVYNGTSIINELIISMGKDITLSGRTNIWMLVIEAIKVKPLFGYGYGAFWQVDTGPSEFITNLLDMPLDQAHNGYLNITLELGVVGLVIFLLSLLQNIFNSMRLQLYTKGYLVIFPLTFMMFFFIFNMSESIIVAQNSASWIIYSILSTYLSYQSVQNKAEVNDENRIQLNSC